MSARTCIYCNEPLEKADVSNTCYACDTEKGIIDDAWSFVDDADDTLMYDGIGI